MLPQEVMIEKLRQLCQADQRIVAACLYGSFTTGEADEYSDIECVLFFESNALPSIDKRQWVEQLASLSLFFADDFGHYTAIFSNLLRGEFHFEPVDHLANVIGWKGNAWFPSLEAAILQDRTGELARQLQPLIGAPPERDTPEMAERLIANFINLTVFSLNTLKRGEVARSLDLLSLQHRYLLWMVRLAENATAHFPTPSRALEKDISAASYHRFVACTGRATPEDLCRAYTAAWLWGQELIATLSARHKLEFSEDLLRLIGQRISDLKQAATDV